MEATHRRTGLVLGGALAALLAGGLIAWALMVGHREERLPPPPASQGGLVIESAAERVGPVDAARPLRCFVDGQLIGELTLAQCAQRNGVATEALDVGVDPSGALAAAPQAGTMLTPLPPAGSQPVGQTGSAPAAAPRPSRAIVGACWRYADGEWRKLPSETTLGGCAQALFAGRCERPGGAAYGRWMQQTLRLVPGRVEISSDDQAFRTFAEQGPGCTIP